MNHLCVGVVEGGDCAGPSGIEMDCNGNKNHLAQEINEGFDEESAVLRHRQTQGGSGPFGRFTIQIVSAVELFPLMCVAFKKFTKDKMSILLQWNNKKQESNNKLDTKTFDKQ